MSKNFHVMLHLLLKGKLKHVGHMWITSGLFYGSVGQMGQQVRPTKCMLLQYGYIRVASATYNSDIAIL